MKSPAFFPLPFPSATLSAACRPLALLLTSVLLLPIGCGATDHAPPPPPTSPTGGQAGDDGPMIGACEGDETLERTCTVYITQSSGVTSCFSGVQYCDDGKWSECFGVYDEPRTE
jgi:hypothetical protein